MKRLYIDVETTGFNPYKNGIIQIAGIVEIDEVEIESFSFDCNVFEKDEISDKALEVNNKTREQIAEFEDPKEVYSKLINIMEKHINRYNKNDKFAFVGFNASFDYDFIRAWFKKAGDNFGIGSWCWNPYIDAMTIAFHFIGEERHLMENFKLDTVAGALGIEVDENELHDALYDVKLTRQIYRQLLSY